MIGPEYPKINSVYKRDDNGKFTDGEFSTPEFDYLKFNEWIWTEKVDGTNIRVTYDGATLTFAGRTNRAEIPTFLQEKLTSLITPEGIEEALTKPVTPENPVTIYGEGYGNKIQKVGAEYIPEGCSFIAFDVLINGMWLEYGDMARFAHDMGVMAVPVVSYTMPLAQAVMHIRNAADPSITSVNLPSRLADIEAEGIVGRPANGMLDRRGRRIITKLKLKDFR